MKVKDPRYNYHTTVAAQIIIRNNNNEILLTRRPDTWEWAPGRWSLIGGKVYMNETFAQAIKRKTKQEFGREIAPEGLYEVKHLIIKDKIAYIYFFVAKCDDIKWSGEMEEYKWFNKSEIERFKDVKFSEYFYKKMLLKYLTEIDNILPFPKIQSLDYTKLSKTVNYKKWFKGVINTNYNPDIIPDFVKWKKKNSNKVQIPNKE